MTRKLHNRYHRLTGSGNWMGGHRTPRRFVPWDASRHTERDRHPEFKDFVEVHPGMMTETGDVVLNPEYDTAEFQLMVFAAGETGGAS